MPPKNLFCKPYPADLWTVPACAKCNGSYSKDDEYFRIALTITERAKDHAGREAILPTVMRGINSERAERFRSRLLSQTTLVPRFTPAGPYLGKQSVISLDAVRINRVVERIVKALFFRLKGHRLPNDHAVNVMHRGRVGELADVHPEVDLAVREFVSLLLDQPLMQRGDAFAFRWIQSPNGHSHTMWLLDFYGHTEFFCTTFAVTSVRGKSLQNEIAAVQSLRSG